MGHQFLAPLAGQLGIRVTVLGDPGLAATFDVTPQIVSASPLRAGVQFTAPFSV